MQRLQRRLGQRPTGVAGPPLLRRLRIALPAMPAVVAATQPGGYVKFFPVAGTHSYADDWGAPRAQGSHEGTDILAARFTPLVAADAGVVSKLSRSESGRGGVYVWIRRRDGVQYYYAHMQAVADGIDVGVPVRSGQVVGSVGNSGDARYGATHVHFEVRRGWTPLNPFPELVAADPDPIHRTNRAA